MERLKLGLYHEVQQHRVLRLVWSVFNSMCFSLLGRRGKVALLKCFGANVKRWSLYRRGVKIFAPWNLTVGNALLGPRVELYNKDKVTIGDAVVISQDAYLCTASHDISSLTMDLVTKPIVIEDNVWIAARAIILPGVTIGEGAVVGCGAVVAKDVPPWSVVVGNPARVVGRRMLKDQIKETR